MRARCPYMPEAAARPLAYPWWMNRRTVLALAAAFVPTAARAQSLTTIRVGQLGNTDGSALPIYAQAAGFYKKYGLDATVTSYTGGAAIIAAIAGGSLDIGFSNITSAVQAMQRGIPIIALAPANLANAGHNDALLVRAR